LQLVYIFDCTDEILKQRESYNAQNESKYEHSGLKNYTTFVLKMLGQLSY